MRSPVATITGAELLVVTVAARVFRPRTPVGAGLQVTTALMDAQVAMVAGPIVP